jgi:hypothetical protein
LVVGRSIASQGARRWPQPGLLQAPPIQRLGTRASRRCGQGAHRRSVEGSAARCRRGDEARS